MLVSTDGRFSTLTSRSIFSKAVVHRIRLISYRREQRALRSTRNAPSLGHLVRTQ